MLPAHTHTQTHTHTHTHTHTYLSSRTIRSANPPLLVYTTFKKYNSARDAKKRFIHSADGHFLHGRWCTPLIRRCCLTARQSLASNKNTALSATRPVINHSISTRNKKNKLSGQPAPPHLTMDRPPVSVRGFPPRSSFLSVELRQSMRDRARLAGPPTRFHDSPSDVSCMLSVT